MSLERDIKSLAQAPFFAAMDHEALRLMAFAAEKRNVATGDVLFRKGEMGDVGFLVLSGIVDLIPAGPNRDTRPATAGVLVGANALLAPVRRKQTATAREPSTVLAISRALFTRVLREYPANARTVRRFWARELHAKLLGLTGSDRPLPEHGPRAAPSLGPP